MKLLILTQKVDKNDPVLGFFHRWIIEFAKHCERVTVICLAKGEYDLPNSVKVLSLGKEEGASRLKYVWRLGKYLATEHKNYDTVFVHMNQEYVLLAGWWWRLFGRKIWLWRNHPQGTWRTRLAVALANRVFCTSPQSFTARFAKTEQMPVGIDTIFFHPKKEIKKIPHSILFLGRVSPIKKPELFIEALALLAKDGVGFVADIVGDALPQDKFFYERLKRRVEELGLSEIVKFHPGVTNEETLDIYNQHEIYVNLTPTGSFDKTIFEAMACGNVVVVSNKTFSKLISPLCISIEDDLYDIVNKIKALLRSESEELKSLGDDLRGYVVSHHSLDSLLHNLFFS